jgi:hypothetical protein
MKTGNDKVIQLVHKSRKKKPEDGIISFPELQCWNPQTLVATFIAELNGDRINCRIKFSDLKKIFPKVTDDPMQSISKYRNEVENIAMNLIIKNRFESDGSIFIRMDDLVKHN